MSESAQWLGFGLALVSTVGTAVTAITAAAVKIVQARHNAELAAVRAAQEKCEEESARCAAERSADRAELQKVKAEAEARDDADRAALETRIAALERKAAGA